MVRKFTANSYMNLMVRCMSRNGRMHRYLGIHVHYINRQHHHEEGALRAATLGIREDRFSVDHRQTRIMNLNRRLILSHGRTIISFIVRNPGLLQIGLPVSDNLVYAFMDTQDYNMCRRLGLHRCLRITLNYLIRHHAYVVGSNIYY